MDLGRLTGIAMGQPGAAPVSRTEILSQPRAGLAVQCGNLIALLDQELRDKPDAVAKEAPFSLAAFADKRVAEAVVKSAYGLAAVVEGMCRRYGVPCHSVPAATVRKHFIGRANLGNRKATKQAVITRCIQLGYVPRDCKDEDRCDALAVFDWACAHIAKKPGAFRLFEGRAA